MISYIKLGIKLVILFLQNKIVTSEDIARSYTKISSKYEDMYLKIMHRYNDLLLKTVNFDMKKEIDILDLGGGTGYNSRFLKRIYPNAKIDLVDNSIGMLEKVNDEGVSVYKGDMLDYLRKCVKEYDLIVCTWAAIYSSPRKIVSECYRVLKKGGLLKVIVNMRNTLPEIRSIFPKLLVENIPGVNKLMFELPTPKSMKCFDSWFGSRFICHKKQRGKQEFVFNTREEAVDFVVSTGALAGYDVMLDLHSREVKEKMAELLKEPKITHSFVYGIYRKRSR